MKKNKLNDKSDNQSIKNNSNNIMSPIPLKNISWCYNRKKNDFYNNINNFYNYDKQKKISTSKSKKN